LAWLAPMRHHFTSPARSGGEVKSVLFHRLVAAIIVHRMQSRRRATLVLAVLLAGTSGCSPYDPPVRGDHTAQQYQTDLDKCRTSSQESVRLKNAATLWSWIISPFTGPPEVRAKIRTCMAGKGYVLEKSNG
jgi:hypothetical protein